MIGDGIVDVVFIYVLIGDGLLIGVLFGIFGGVVVVGGIVVVVVSGGGGDDGGSGVSGGGVLIGLV